MTTSLNEELLDLRVKSLPAEVWQVLLESIVVGTSGAVKGLPIGARAPDFALENQAGVSVRLRALLAHGPVVLGFFRGEWCPFCTLELRALVRITPLLAGHRARLLLVHPQDHRASHRLAVQHQGDYDMCSDADQSVMRDFDVRFEVTPKVITLYRDTFGLDLSELNANGEWNLPVPATFVIDTDGIVKARQFSHDFTVRAEPSYVLDSLAALPASTPEFAKGSPS
jgi:peroxiredoxin